MIKWLLRLLGKRVHHHNWSWNPLDTDAVGPDGLMVFRYDVIFPDGTVLHKVRMFGESVTQKFGYHRLQKRPELEQVGVSYQEYRKMLRDMRLEYPGKVRVIKSRIRSGPDHDTIQKATIRLDGHHDSAMDTWEAVYWILVGKVWLRQTFQDANIRAVFGHLLEHSTDDNIQVWGYYDAGIQVDRNEMAITMALFRDSYGILGLIPENWEQDGADLPDAFSPSQPIGLDVPSLFQ